MNAGVLNPFALARRQFRRWWQARLPLSDTIELTQRNVYILPTRPGFMLGPGLSSRSARSRLLDSSHRSLRLPRRGRAWQY
jgi:hypothetical protein